MKLSFRGLVVMTSGTMQEYVCKLQLLGYYSINSAVLYASTDIFTLCFLMFLLHITKYTKQRKRHKI